MICSVYDTDLSDSQWQLIQPFIPAPLFGGRPRKTNERQALNGILYILKTGAHWRLLPKHNFPPWQTVYRYFRLWNEIGIWQNIHSALHGVVRAMAGRDPKPSAVVIDSQSIKTGKMAAIESRGYDGGKRVKGRKRHIVVDTLGLMVGVKVTTANVHDTKGAQEVLEKVIKNQKKKEIRIKTIFADKGYSGINFSGWVKKNVGAIVEVGKNLTTKFTNFIPAKKRWVVERGFAWLGDYRRLVIDQERLIEVSTSFVYIAIINILIGRIYPSEKVKWL
jgi:putative transposase